MLHVKGLTYFGKDHIFEEFIFFQSTGVSFTRTFCLSFSSDLHHFWSKELIWICFFKQLTKKSISDIDFWYVCNLRNDDNNTVMIHQTWHNLCVTLWNSTNGSTHIIVIIVISIASWCNFTLCILLPNIWATIQYLTESSLVLSDYSHFLV